DLSIMKIQNLHTLSQKRQHSLIELAVLIVHTNMSGSGKHEQASVGEFLAYDVSEFGGNQEIFVAPDDQRTHCNLAHNLVRLCHYNILKGLQEREGACA